MCIYSERKENGRQRVGLITRTQEQSERLASVCDEVEAVFFSRGGRG